MTEHPYRDHLAGPLPGLTPELVTALPREWQDRLLHYVRIWGDANQLLELAFRIGETYGSPIHQLDLEADALAAVGRHADALSVIGRRLRRSPATAALAFELRELYAAGQHEHARHAAHELLRTYPDNIAIATTAALILGEAGQFDLAQEALLSLSAQRPDDAHILVTLARLAQNAQQPALADEYLQRLGTGVSPNHADEDLDQLATLHAALGSAESARAVRVELDRRRRQQLAELCTVLDPLAELSPERMATSDDAFLFLDSLSSMQASDDERRTITLEAIRRFGFTELREGQIETIATVLRGESILVVMPTGAGKSFCYQLPALMLDGTTLVVSPLVALMKDQVENLPAAERRRATFINSTLTDDQMEARLRGVSEGRYKLVYAAPERLRHLAFLRTLRKVGVSLFVVDEAHCVSLWGHDFRPDYLFLQTARHELGYPPALAMTATAPPRVRDEIIGYISDAPSDPTDASEATHVLALDVFRSNLRLSALQFNGEDEKLAALTAYAAANEGSGIVYVNSRRKSESLAYALRQAGVHAEAYHAGLDQRSDVQDRFMSGETRVIVATIAFGMGIDKPDIRFIVHFHPPRSLASYYQEVGRAGRDGEPSDGILFFSHSDWSNLRRWAKADEYSVEFLLRVYAAVASQLGLTVDEDQPAIASDEEVAGPVDALRLQAVLDTDETSVRVAVSILERVGLLDRGFDIPELVEITRPPDAHGPPARGSDISRLYKGLDLKPGESASFKLAAIAAYMKWPLESIEPRLLDLAQDGLLKVRFERRRMFVTLAPAPSDTRARLQRLLDHNSALSQRRIDDVIGYATTTTCRHGALSAHLGSRPITTCTACDNCTGLRPEITLPEILPQPELSDTQLAAIIIDCLSSLPRAVGRHGLARILAGALRAPVQPDEARHFGSLRALGQSAIVQAIDDLIAARLLRQYDRDGYPLLSATLSGRNLAHSERVSETEAPTDAFAYTPADSANGDTHQEPTPDALETDAGKAPAADGAATRYTKLQMAIWAWRRRTAERHNLPAYAIMDNEVLFAIAAYRPATLTDLAAIPGIGAQRLDRYGPALLDLVRLNPPQQGDEELLGAQRAERESARASADPSGAKAAAVHADVARAILLRLQELCQRQAVQQRCRSTEIAGNRLLRAIADAAPETREQLLAVRGFRSSGLSAHADAILSIIADGDA